MKVTERTRRMLAVCREGRALAKRGYRRYETDWEIHRGYRTGEVIQDAIISVDGKHVYTLVGPALEMPDRRRRNGNM